jgi:hypothetical protein
LNKNILAIGIILLLIGVSVIPSISGNINKNENIEAVKGQNNYIIHIKNQKEGRNYLDDLPIEEWNKTYGEFHPDRFYSVKPTSDNGYIATGFTQSYGNIGKPDLWLIKTDNFGEIIWDEVFSEEGITSEGYYVEETIDNGFIVTGTSDTFSGNERDIILIKTDSNGVLQWNKIFDSSYNDDAYTVHQTSDGGFIISGHSKYDGDNIYFWLIKTDEKGNEQWNRTYLGNDPNYCYSMEITNDGGYIMTGYNGQGFRGTLLVKTNSNGIEEWRKIYSSNSGVAYSVKQTKDKGYILTGSKDKDLWLLKTDSEGNEEWSKRLLNSEVDEIGLSVELAQKDGFIITGYTYNDTSVYYEIILVKTDLIGNVEGLIKWGSFGQRYGQEIQKTSDGGYIICGSIYPKEGGNDNGILIKITSETANQPPDPPIITGPNNGKIGEVYEYILYSTDPDGDTIKYQIDWNDESWSGSNTVKSGTEVSLNHTWTEKGTYVIKARTVDDSYSYSDWTEFEIKISKPRNRAWMRFIDMFPILKILLQRLGLQ